MIEGAEYASGAWIPAPPAFRNVEGVVSAARIGDFGAHINLSADEEIRGRFLAIDRLDFPTVAWFRPVGCIRGASRGSKVAFQQNWVTCGHTHGGQVRLPRFGALITSSDFWKRYEMGRYKEGGTTLYVSRGLGMEGLGAPRTRSLAPPEIVLWTLSS